MIITGWPDDIKDVPKALWPYHGQCDSLTIEDGLILQGEVIIVPPRREEEHLGINPSRTLRHIKVPVQGKTMHTLAWHQQRHWTASRSMYHLSETLTSEAKAATEANTTTWATLATTQSRLHDVQWKWIPSHCWLLLKDAYHMEDAYITVLKELFAEHGIPEEIWSDNRLQFASHLFAEFTKNWNIKHSTFSPRNPRSNG